MPISHTVSLLRHLLVKASDGDTGRQETAPFLMGDTAKGWVGSEVMIVATFGNSLNHIAFPFLQVKESTETARNSLRST